MVMVMVMVSTMNKLRVTAMLMVSVRARTMIRARVRRGLGLRLVPGCDYAKKCHFQQKIMNYGQQGKDCNEHTPYSHGGPQQR